MIVTGQYTSAEIFTENIEDAALQWVRAQCDHPAFEGVRDIHRKHRRRCPAVGKGTMRPSGF